MVAGYKNLANIERDFRNSTIWICGRSTNRLEDRVKAHVLICMLACYLIWHLRKAWAPLTFTDEAPPPATTPSPPRSVPPPPWPPNAPANAKTFWPRPKNSSPPSPNGCRPVPSPGADDIGEAYGKATGKYKMGKHFRREITDTRGLRQAISRSPG